MMQELTNAGKLDLAAVAYFRHHQLQLPNS